MSSRMKPDFSPEERAAVYRVIRERRDVRSDFISEEIPDAVLGRILTAAHHAPSVGLMQPWDFILIRNFSIRKQIHAHAQSMKDRGDIYEGDRKALYCSLKLEGILEAPLNICITCDRSRTTGYGLGRQSDSMTDLYSAACAIQNLWLAARAESIGIGWVSILDWDRVKQLLNIPRERHIVAYLCAGFVSAFRRKPELETAGWEVRTKISNLLHFDQWENQDRQRADAILGTHDE
jgi:5,6-dimethylbenzimidazole synthase